MFKRKPQRVYVLGAGPAGLLAAHAAVTKGYDVTVFSKPDLAGRAAKSDLYGCQYLHRYIPNLGMQKYGELVVYKLDGPTEGYRAKVYGQNYTGPTSVDEYGPAADHMAWDIRDAYDELWSRYGTTAVPVDMGPSHIKPLFEDPDGFILNAIPAPALCRDMENHKFVSQQVYAMGSRDPQGVYDMPYHAPDMTVECSGWRDKAWYRAATVFGYSTLEWPGGKRPPISGVVPVSKPLSTDCTCWQSKRSVRVGRFGKWTKGVLVHTAYFDAMEVLP